MPAPLVTRGDPFTAFKDALEVFVNEPIGKPAQDCLNSSTIYGNDRGDRFGPEKYTSLGGPAPPPPRSSDGLSYGLIDTGALLPMGGSDEMQMLHQVSRGTSVQDSTATFRGIKASAVVESLGLCEFQCAIAGVPIKLGFEGTSEPIPLLFALPHLDGLGAVLDLPHRLIHFTAIGRWSVPLHLLGKGLIGVRLDDWNGEEGSPEPPEHLKAQFQNGIEVKKEQNQVKTNNIFLQDGTNTRIMKKKQRVWFEEEMEKFRLEDNLLYNALFQENTTFGGDIFENVGLANNVNAVHQAYHEFEKDDGRILHLDFSNTSFQEKSSMEDLNELKDLADAARHQANLRYWSDVIKNRTDRGQEFVMQLPLDVDSKELGPLQWIVDDHRLRFASSWCGDDEAKGVHGLPYSELPEHAWVSSSTFLLEKMINGGYQGLHSVLETEILEQYAGEEQGRKRGRDQQAPGRGAGPVEPASVRRRVAAATGTSSSSSSSGDDSGYQGRVCPRCKARREGTTTTAPHIRADPQCSQHGISFVPPKRKAPGEASGTGKRQRIPVIATRSRSASSLFREVSAPNPEEEDDDDSDEVGPAPLAERDSFGVMRFVILVGAPEATTIPWGAIKRRVTINLDDNSVICDENVVGMPDTELYRALPTGISNTRTRFYGEPPEAEHHQPGDRELPEPDEDGELPEDGLPDPDRERDPVLLPTPEDRAEAERRKEWKKIPLVVRRALRRFHANMGHYGRDAMVRTLRLARASPIAIKGASLMRCDACDETRHAQVRGGAASDLALETSKFGVVTWVH